MLQATFRDHAAVHRAARRVPAGAEGRIGRRAARAARRAKPAIADEALFARVVAAAFGQRRKTLRNALAAICDEAALRDAAAIDPARARRNAGGRRFRAAREPCSPRSASGLRLVSAESDESPREHPTAGCVAFEGQSTSADVRGVFESRDRARRRSHPVRDLPLDQLTAHARREQSRLRLVEVASAITRRPIMHAPDNKAR